MKKPSIFIGMPVYNGERFIKAAIDSLINQNFDNWQLFISDDASTDSTQEIAMSYAVSDSRITYHRQQKNLGLFANFKFTLDQASTDYFMWAAQDDVWEKDFIKTCVEHLENDSNLGLVTTCNEAIDSFDRVIVGSPAMTKLSGKPGVLQVAKYVLQPEGMGKCNLMYGVFRTENAKKTWAAYPQRRVWGQDYMFSLAAISRFGVFVDSKVLFKKRLGGYSSPQLNLTNPETRVTGIVSNQPKNQMFPFGRFNIYFAGHMEALVNTPYRSVAGLMLLLRLPRALYIHIKERNIKRFLLSLIKIRPSPIVVKLNGGLCNQIFQYAFARSLSKKLNRDFRLDITPFSTYYKADPYGLWKFNIQEKISSESELYGFVWLRKHNKIFSFIYNRLRLKSIIKKWYYMEHTFMYDPQVLLTNASYFDGFWQTEKYFKDIEDDIRTEITLKTTLSTHSQKILTKIESVNAVSLHVRRYASEGIKPWHGFCSAEYYLEAIGRITEKVDHPHFFIFSDNYKWVEENFLPVIKKTSHEFTLVYNDNEKNAEDLILMSKCKHHIIANSSFSWWGAWLNPRKDKIVVAPKKWFSNAPKNNTEDLIPTNWIRL